MRRLLLAVAALALAALPATALARAKQVSSAGTYGHAGRFITDAQGRVVTFHGVDEVNKVPASGYAPDGTGFGRDDARFLARNGFTMVRLGIIWKALEPQPGVYDNAYLSRIFRTYRVLHEQGISVLLDFHQDMYNERFQGEGAPDWAILGQAATETPTPQLGFPNNYFFQAAVNHAYDAFWANTQVPGTGRGVQDFYAAAWAQVAKRFRGKPGILGYNLFNEPWGGTPLQTCLVSELGGTSPTTCGVREFDQNVLAPFDRRVGAAIRKVDKTTLLWPAPLVTFDQGFQTGFVRTDKREGLAFNAYCPINPDGTSIIPFQRGKTCTQTATETIGYAVAASRRTGAALVDTEFGASDDFDAWVPYMQALDDNLIGWTYWSYCGCGDPTGSIPPDLEGLVLDPTKPPTGDNVKAAKLSVLAQPYAAITAGTPRKSAWDATTRSLSYVYGTKPAGKGRSFGPGSVTTLEVPGLQYPTGYGVRIHGARVISKPRARTLRLAQCGRAKRVRIEIGPGKTQATARKCG
jgi:endoglycosylceramidase